MTYARFKNVQPHFWFGGAVNHFPEGAVVCHCGPKVNAVYQLVEEGPAGVVISSMERIVFEDERIMAGPSLFDRLCAKFDSAGGPLRQRVVAHSLIQWVPQIGDEIVTADGTAVVIGLTVSDYSKDIRQMNIADDGTIELSKQEQVENISFYSSTMRVAYVSTDCPVYGECLGGPPGDGFVNIQPVEVEVKSLSELQEKVRPILGRDKVDITRRGDQWAFYRRHYGRRGFAKWKCIDDDGTPLVSGQGYGVDMVGDMKWCQKLPVLVGDDYYAFRAGRFEPPAPAYRRQS